MSCRADFLAERKWGVFEHFLSSAFAQKEPMTPGRWNEIVNNYNVDKVAEFLASVNAGYFCITIGQNCGYFCSPNATYDRLLNRNESDSRCSRRDLIMDMAKVLDKYGIPMLVYLPANAPFYDLHAMKTLDYHDPVSGSDKRLRTFQNHWENIIREWSLRWGSNVRGWWIDGCYFASNDAMYGQDDAPNFRSFAAAMRAGNPDSAVAWNHGVADPQIFNTSVEEDYTAGECCRAESVFFLGAKELHANAHVLSYIGNWWGAGDSRYSPDELRRITASINSHGAFVTWDVAFEADGMPTAEMRERLTALKDLPPSGSKEINIPRMLSGLLMPPEETADKKGLIFRFRNSRNNPVAGKVGISGERLQITSAKEFYYDLQPGQECSTVVEFSLDKDVMCGLIQFDFGGGIVTSWKVLARPQVTISEETQHFEFTGGGEIWLKKDGNGIAFQAKIPDDLLVQDGTFYGSGMEFFVGKPGSSSFEHQYLASAGYQVIRENVDRRLPDVPDAVLHSTVGDGGFTMEGRIPVEWDEFQFEIARQSGESGKMVYRKLFNSFYPAEHTEGSALVKFQNK